MRDVETMPRSGVRSPLATAALAFTALSALALVAMVVGQAVGAPGFSEGAESSALADAVWITFVLAGIVALVLGLVTWIRGRARQIGGDVRAGQIAVVYVIFAIVLTVVVSMGTQ